MRLLMADYLLKKYRNAKYPNSWHLSGSSSN